jgi:hypothetical protein
MGSPFILRTTPPPTQRPAQGSLAWAFSLCLYCALDVHFFPAQGNIEWTLSFYTAQYISSSLFIMGSLWLYYALHFLPAQGSYRFILRSTFPPAQKSLAWVLYGCLATGTALHDILIFQKSEIAI